MEEKEFICIVCPKGCNITVAMEGEHVTEVKDSSCPRGEKYATDEATDPKRLVFSTVQLEGGPTRMLPVRTRESVPRGKVTAIMQKLAAIVVDAPVTMGDIILDDVCGTGTDVVASWSVEKRS
ncbi:MAG: DUF1667 domain-containing protein [Candidatus Undinarchaeales archaeon]|jgi:CxxC motif-containing protein|nr:DUF1667 domain-containing protein [Candidatus Undinarchaeales archaeon]MDP7494054.1 DUF1667 domain-containing protein [Candidatus Undinarchaeales archaeon]